MRSKRTAPALILGLIALGAISAKVVLRTWPGHTPQKKVLEPAPEGPNTARPLRNEEGRSAVKAENSLRVPDLASLEKRLSEMGDEPKIGPASGKPGSPPASKGQVKHLEPTVTPNHASPELATGHEPLPPLAGRPNIRSDEDQKVTQPGSRALARGQSGSPELSEGRVEADKKEEVHHGQLVIPSEKQRELMRRYMEALSYLNE